MNTQAPKSNIINLDGYQTAPEVLEKTEIGQEPKVRRKLRGRLLADYVGKPINDGDTLLGNRYLCRGGGMFIVAPSGIGKSVFSIQTAIEWSAGRRSFGINPARATRILIVQAEDDEGDVIEMSNIADHLKLNPEQFELFKRNVWMEPMNDLTGLNFIETLDGFLEEWPADLVIINPYTSFLGGEIKDDGYNNQFLRNWLNPIVAKRTCAVVIIHHTPKTNFRDTSEWKSSD